MTLLPGKNFIADSNCLIYESGDDVTTISYIVKGSVVAEGQYGTTTYNAGDFVGYKDIYTGFYSDSLSGFCRKYYNILFLL